MHINELADVLEALDTLKSTIQRLVWMVNQRDARIVELQEQNRKLQADLSNAIRECVQADDPEDEHY